MSGVDMELRAIWRHHFGGTRASLAGFESVIGRHREPHRRYHGVAHIRWVIRHVDTIVRDGTPTIDRTAIVAAAFYHDAVYDPHRFDNEAASARLAVTELTALGWDVARAITIGELIVATAAHADVSGDAAVLVDADLAVLGADPAGYQTYVAGVRYEYRHLDDIAWAEGRTAVLRSFLDRHQIFCTPAGRARWESTARANLAAEVASLEIVSRGR